MIQPVGQVEERLIELNMETRITTSLGSQVSRHLVVFPFAPSQLASYTNQLQSKLRVIREEESIKRRGVREPFRSGYLVAGDRVFPGSIELRFIPSANTVCRSESSGEPDDKALSEQTGWYLDTWSRRRLSRSEKASLPFPVLSICLDGSSSQKVIWLEKDRE